MFGTFPPSFQFLIKQLTTVDHLLPAVPLRPSPFLSPSPAFIMSLSFITYLHRINALFKGLTEFGSLITDIYRYKGQGTTVCPIRREKKKVRPCPPDLVLNCNQERRRPNIVFLCIVKPTDVFNGSRGYNCILYLKHGILLKREVILLSFSWTGKHSVVIL